MTVGVVIGSDLEPLVQIRWGARFAAIRGEEIVVVLPVANAERDRQSVAVDPEAEPDGDAAPEIRAIRDAVAEIENLAWAPLEGEEADEPAQQPAPAEPEGPAVTRVRLRILYHAPDYVDALLAEVRNSKFGLLVSCRKELDTGDLPTQIRRQFFRRAPCGIAFVRVGPDGDKCRRLLVPAGRGPHGRFALQTGHDLAAHEGGECTALRVNPDIGADARLVGLHALDGIVRRALGKDAEAVARDVVVDQQPHRGISKAADRFKPDVIILGASKQSALGQRLVGTVGGKLMRSAPASTVIIMRAANPITSRFGHWVEEVLQRNVPQLEREHRIDLVSRVQSNSQFDFDFVTLIALSTVIAAIGLMQSSAAVVIGAMLVAPLMTPILGLGIALGQGNPVFSRMAMRSIALGFLVAIAAGVVVGLLSTLGGFVEPTPEMLARGGPGVLDLFVAFASGMAAAYASSRPNLLAALPGVAIAAALVPPIATAGLALSIGRFQLAFGATLLFVINMVTIVLATQLSLWAVGLRNMAKTSRTTSWVGKAVILAVVTLAVYLAVSPPAEQGVEDVMPTPKTLLRLVQQRLDREGGAFRLQRIDVAHSERGLEVLVRVAGERLASKELAEEIRLVVLGQLGGLAQVRLINQWDAQPPGAAPK